MKALVATHDIAAVPSALGHEVAGIVAGVGHCADQTNLGFAEQALIHENQLAVVPKEMLSEYLRSLKRVVVTSF
jgi:hypothetical protein